MRFRIEALMYADPAPETIVLDSFVGSRRPAASRSETTQVADDLLPYYNRELTYIRRLSAEFAAETPEDRGPPAPEPGCH
jgi:hypothetical protein